MIPWKGGKPLVWDATCWDNSAPFYFITAIESAGSVAVEAEHRKRLKYSHLKLTHHFIIVAVKILGVIGSEGCSLLPVALLLQLMNH